MAAKIFRLLCCALVVVFCLINMANGTVDGTPCDSAKNGTAICMGANANSECKAGETHCSCVANYLLKTDKSACTEAITAVACNPGSGGLVTCQAEDTNAECSVDTGYCTCKGGYEQNPDFETACLKKGNTAQTAVLSVGLILAVLLVVFQNIF